jgi:peroxiredoxin
MADERKGAVTLRGNPITLGGPEIKAGQSAPDFTALDNGLKPVKLSEAKGKVIILSSVPSLDTPTCDTETRRFNQEAAKLGGNVEIWTISRDLPFAQKRWCGAAGVSAVKTLSDFRERAFGQICAFRERRREHVRERRARRLRAPRAAARERPPRHRLRRPDRRSRPAAPH